MLRFALHLVLHVVAPAALARVVAPRRWVCGWLVMLATMVVDLDHLLAHPVLDPQRCSLGFHPLHSPWAIVAYALLAALPRTRLVGLGLLLHMALDALDCVLQRC
ncbi:MAG TPA: DUF6122 family protein [Polyangia bacterium]|jgi:hypothetical protein